MVRSPSLFSFFSLFTLFIVCLHDTMQLPTADFGEPTHFSGIQGLSTFLFPPHIKSDRIKYGGNTGSILDRPLLWPLSCSPSAPTDWKGGHISMPHFLFFFESQFAVCIFFAHFLFLLLCYNPSTCCRDGLANKQKSQNSTLCRLRCVCARSQHLQTNFTVDLDLELNTIHVRETLL